MLIICNALPEISQTKAMDNTFKEAEAIATQHIVELQEKIGMALLLTKNQEASFDWVFFYQSKEYMETENLSSMLAGNAPFIVDRQTGEIHTLGTVHSAEFYIKQYAQLRG